MDKLEGLIAAPFTPMHEDGSLHAEVIPSMAEALAADGIVGAFVCGTTGEGLSLSTDERMVVAETWARSSPPGMRVIVHVGHTSIREAQQLAEHAAATGADAIAAMPASPLGSRAVEDVAAYVRAIAQVVPETPVFYYHIPAVSGVAIRVADLLSLLGPSVPNLAGAKYTHEDLYDFGRSQQVDGGRFDMLFGRDEMLLAGLVQGARGAVGSTYNFAAPLFSRMLRAFEGGALPTAQRLQAEAQDIISILMEFPGLAAQKHLMGRIGPELGPVRVPMRGLTELERNRLDEAFERTDLVRRVRHPSVPATDR